MGKQRVEEHYIGHGRQRAKIVNKGKVALCRDKEGFFFSFIYNCIAL